MSRALKEVMDRQYRFVTPVERHSSWPLLLGFVITIAAFAVGWAAHSIPQQNLVPSTPTVMATVAPTQTPTVTPTPTITPFPTSAVSKDALMGMMGVAIQTLTPTMIAGYLPCNHASFGELCYPLATATPTETPTPRPTATPVQLCKPSDYQPTVGTPCRNNQGVNPWT